MSFYIGLMLGIWIGVFFGVMLVSLLSFGDDRKAHR